MIIEILISMLDLMIMNVRLMLILLRYTLNIQRFTDTNPPTKNKNHTVGKFMARVGLSG